MHNYYSFLLLRAKTEISFMRCVIETKHFQEIEASNIPQQTAFWAQVKYKQGMKPFGFHYTVSGDLLSPAGNGKKAIGHDLLVLVQYINANQCFAYVPYGPKDEPDFENHGLFLEELSEVLRPYLPENCILIRYDLPWENQWAQEDDFYDENGNWTGPPPQQNQEFRVNFNTRNWNLLKSHTDILPSNTIFLNLNQNREKLLKNMKAKTRYNIRLSFRKGVNVQSYGLEKLDEWYELYSETASRNNITLHPKEGFREVLGNKNENDVTPELLMADLDGDYLAAMFLLLSKKRGTYLFGASSGKKRNLMATYAVQWEAIKRAQEAGCEEYDLFGTAPNANAGHPMYGLNRFKTGFGGYFYHRMGCWDYPLNQNKYPVFRAQEVNNQSYHKE